MEEIRTDPEQNLGDKPLPNATAVLVLGILSIPGCCCLSGSIGLILGIIALVLSAKDLKLYRETPDIYSIKSYKNLNAGRICAIIGLVLSAVILIISIIGMIYGEMWDIPQSPEDFEDWMEKWE